MHRPQEPRPVSAPSNAESRGTVAKPAIRTTGFGPRESVSFELGTADPLTGSALHFEITPHVAVALMRRHHLERQEHAECRGRVRKTVRRSKPRDESWVHDVRVFDAYPLRELCWRERIRRWLRRWRCETFRDLRWNCGWCIEVIRAHNARCQRHGDKQRCECCEERVHDESLCL